MHKLSGIIDPLATSLNRRYEVPNRELAKNDCSVERQKFRRGIGRKPENKDKNIRPVYQSFVRNGSGAACSH